MSAETMAYKIGISSRAVEKQIAKLRSMDILSREGENFVAIGALSLILKLKNKYIRLTFEIQKHKRRAKFNGLHASFSIKSPIATYFTSTKITLLNINTLYIAWYRYDYFAPVTTYLSLRKSRKTATGKL